MNEEELQKAKFIINAYKAACPEGWISFCEGMKRKRALLKDYKFGKWDKKERFTDGRSIAQFPNDKKGNNLLNVLEGEIPDLLSDKKLLDFLDKFPEFKVPEAI